MIKGIIFDMDGVLVLGANKYHVEAWEKAFREFDIDLQTISEDEYGKLEGMKGDEIENIILKQNNILLSPELKDRIYKRKKEIFKEIDDPYAPRETKTLLNDLKNQGLKLAVASGNNRYIVENFIKKYNLQEIFGAIITGDEIEKGKPDPEVFLTALKKIDLHYNECIVVENAPLGIQAGKAAGIYVVAMTSTVSANFLKGADKIISNLSELKEIIKNTS